MNENNNIDSKRAQEQLSDENTILAREIDILFNNIDGIIADDDNYNKLREKLFDMTVNLSQEIVSLTRDIAGLTTRVKLLNGSKTADESNR
ncbi:MAG: hypothetical protein PF588_00320 [Candidatus Kapabacteria bacterium]|nr:hypothetical protein [Candidatus Kapabacteria bacterium]